MIALIHERQESLTFEKTKKQSSPIPEPNGLCANCEHACDCMHLKNAKQSVQHCEEYKSCACGGPTSHGCVSRLSVDETSSDGARMKGLCMNCDHRDTCTFPKPEGGVWHCEEYC